MNWPLIWRGTVAPDWLDELDHVNFLEYQRVADLASLEIWRRAGEGSAARLQFVMTETHVRYRRELRLGMDVEVTSVLLAFDSKRFQLLHHIRSAGELMCSVETLNLCFDPESRKVVDFDEGIASYFRAWPAPPQDAVPHLAITRKPG